MTHKEALQKIVKYAESIYEEANYIDVNEMKQIATQALEESEESYSEEEVRKAIQLARETYLFMDDIIELHNETEIIQSLQPNKEEPLQFLANQAQELNMGYEPKTKEADEH